MTREDPDLVTPPLRPAFRLGARTRDASRHTWHVLTSLVVAAAASAALVGVFSSGAGGGRHLAEAPVPEGAWRVEWTAGVSPPPAEQSRQLRSLGLVAGGVAGMVSVLCLMIALTLWWQRLRRRASADHVHWAVGASRRQLAARVSGEGWPWGVLAIASAVGAGWLVPFMVNRTFPGTAEVPAQLGAASIVAVAVSVVIVRWGSHAGIGSTGRWGGPVAAALSSPVAVAVVGFALLTGVGLLTRHAPAWGSAADGLDRRVASVSLSALSPDRRESVLSGWGSSTQEAARPFGLASAGAVRGTGRTTEVWVDCGQCYEGGLPVPIRSVRAELHAVASDTFPHLGLRLLSGRDFDEGVDVGPLRVAVVSRSMAARHFEDGRAIGRTIRVGDSRWLTVVGVVDDSPDARDHRAYTVYLPIAQAVPSEVEVIAGSAPSEMEAALRGAPSEAVVGAVRGLPEVFAVHGWFSRLVGLFGVAAYGLVFVGTWLGARNEARGATFELALRKAVGARRRDLRLHLLGRMARRLLTVSILGAWLSLFLGAALVEAYGGMPNLDWTVWAVVGLMVAVAYVGGALPAYRKAGRIEPAIGMSAAG